MVVFFFNDTATTEIYTLSLHDALPISDIALNTLGNNRFEKIQKSGLSFEDLWTLPTGEIRGKLGKEKFVDTFLKNREAINPDAKIKKLKNFDINFITIFDDEYPRLLKEIFSPSVVLYYKGNINVLEKPTLAVVGSRKFTTYGKSATEKIVSGLADRKSVV